MLTSYCWDGTADRTMSFSSPATQPTRRRGVRLARGQSWLLQLRDRGVAMLSEYTPDQDFDFGAGFPRETAESSMTETPAMKVERIPRETDHRSAMFGSS